MSEDIVEEPIQADHSYKFLYKDDLLAFIQDTLDEQRMAMKLSDSNKDYLEGGASMLKFIATELGLCSYEDMKDD